MTTKNNHSKKAIRYTPAQALANFLGESICAIKEVAYDTYGAPTFSVGKQEYIVTTDREADAAVTEYIRQAVWAFRPSFLSGMTDIPEEAFAGLASQCESGNDWVLGLVKKTCGWGAFVDAAISADGRGHFLASYDGKEIESGGYYIYRTN